MKVFQINSVCGTGSTGRIAADIARVLQNNGHDCMVAYGRRTAPDDIKTYKMGSDFGINAHVALTRLFDRHCFGSRYATKKLVAQIKEYNPDIIHLHNIHGYYLHAGVLFRFLKEFDRPVVWCTHDCWTFTGHCAYFDLVGCEKWRTGCEHCPQKSEYPASIFLDNSKKNYRQKKELFTALRKIEFAPASIWLKDLLAQSYFSKYHATVIQNGIDLNTFCPTTGDFRQKHNLENKKVILGVASEWTRRKGLDDFVSLSKTLGSEFQIVLVGLNAKQLAELPQNIIGIERTESVKQLAELYTTADVFVNPTYEDNFPTVNLESLACGTPVITYRSGGSAEGLDEFSGVAVDTGDLKGLENAIRTLSIQRVDPAYAKRFDKNARFLDYLTLYKRILTEEKNR